MAKWKSLNNGVIMKSFTLYVDKKSFIHDIDSISKLFFIVFAILLPVILPGLRVSFICAGFGFLLLLSAGVLRNALPVYAFMSFILLTIVLIQGMFGVDNETLAFDLFGLKFYREGLMASAKIVLRALNIIQSFLVLVLTTKPSDLVEDLVEKGLSPRIGYVVNSVFQIIPQMMATVSTITDAQRSRGMETEGGLVVRFKAFVPLLAPVVLNSFMSTKERAMALEVRAFSAKNARTVLHERSACRYGFFIKAALVAMLLAAVCWRVLG